MIRCYDDFIAALLRAGFSMGGGNGEGIYSIVCWDWNQTPPYDTPVRWHTGDPETDPWEWRMRVLRERCDIAYGKVFFRKSGYVTREWLPYFIAARRGGETLEEAYASGTVSRTAKRIYELVSDAGAMPLHLIKREGGFTREDASAFDRALVELQTGFYLTMCGSSRKTSKEGAEYGWSSTVFCTVENRFGEEIAAPAGELTRKEAREKIAGQIRLLNARADEKKIGKFIMG